MFDIFDMDRYRNFRDLAANETEFQVICHDRKAPVTVVAPHGGRIEPNTSEIAHLIAADDHNLFCFNGRKQGSNRDLHITSHRFDNPQALALVQTASIVLSIHGCSVTRPIIYVGGLDTSLINKTCRQLSMFKINTESNVDRFAGINPKNICNRGLWKKGMQIEISRPLRDSPAARQDISAAVRIALLKEVSERG